MQKSAKTNKNPSRKPFLIILSFLLILAIVTFIGTYYNMVLIEREATKQQVMIFDKKIQELRDEIHSVIKNKPIEGVEISNTPTTNIKDAYLLVHTADLSLQSGQNVEFAQILMKLALEHLENLNGPKIEQTKKILAADIAKLNALSVPDKQKLQDQLALLDKLINVLPVQGIDSVAKNQDHKLNSQNKVTWYHRLMENMQGFTGVKIRKRDTHEISVAEIDIARAQFKLLIEQIRWAVFYNNPKIYEESVQKAQTLLPQIFNMHSESVQKFAATLQELQSYKLYTDLPTLQNSVTAIQAILVE